MRLLLGVTSAAVYAGTRLAAGAVGGAVLGVLLHRRTQQRLPPPDPTDPTDLRVPSFRRVSHLDMDPLT